MGVEDKSGKPVSRRRFIFGVALGAAGLAGATAAWPLVGPGTNPEAPTEAPLVPVNGETNVLPSGWMMDLRVTTIDPNKPNRVIVNYDPRVDQHTGLLRYVSTTVDNPPNFDRYVVYKPGTQLNYDPATGRPGLMTSDTLVFDPTVQGQVQAGGLNLYDRPSLKEGKLIGKITPISQVFRMSTLLEGQDGVLRPGQTIFQFNGREATVLGFTGSSSATSSITSGNK